MTRALTVLAAAVALSGCVVVVRPQAQPIGQQLQPQRLQNPCARMTCRPPIDTRKIA